MSKGKLCDIESLKLWETNPNDEVLKMREDYTKYANMLFLPFKDIDDLTIDGSFWKMYDHQLNSADNEHVESPLF